LKNSSESKTTSKCRIPAPHADSAAADSGTAADSTATADSAATAGYAAVLVVVAIGVWGTVPHSTIAALTALGLSVAAANAALEAALESIAHDNMLISRLRHSSPTRWCGA